MRSRANLQWILQKETRAASVGFPGQTGPDGTTGALPDAAPNYAAGEAVEINVGPGSRYRRGRNC
jgi:hypothetical protein